MLVENDDCAQCVILSLLGGTLNFAEIVRPIIYHNSVVLEGQEMISGVARFDCATPYSPRTACRDNRFQKLHSTRSPADQAQVGSLKSTP